MRLFSLAAAALFGICLPSPVAASGETQAGIRLAHLLNQALDPPYRVGRAPAAGTPTTATGRDPAPNATAQAISPSQLVEIEEASYTSCLQGAARHYGALAGRAGPGAGPSGDPYTDCERALKAWKLALIALNPAGGLVAAEAHISGKLNHIAAQTTATWQQAYNDNNYQ